MKSTKSVESIKSLKGTKNKFSSLSVSTEINPYIEVPDVYHADKLKKYLTEYYEKFELFNVYGPKNVENVCGVSANYCFWTLPKHLRYDENIIKGYSLWLSLIWMVDSSFDVKKTKNLIKEKDDITNIIKNVVNNVKMDTSDFIINNNGTKHDMLMSCLNEVVYTTYNKYMTLILPYITLNPESFDKITEWTVKYIERVSDNDIIVDLEEFFNFRLIDSAMMTVVWHLILFMEISSENFNKDHSIMFELTALLVGLHNDIWSLPRDIFQNVNNIVKCMMYNSANTTISTYDHTQRIHEKQGVESAVKLINSMYKHLSELYEQFIKKYPNESDIMETLCFSVVGGSYNWANLEKRYFKGRYMFSCLEKEDEAGFLSVFGEYVIVDGDPDI